MFTAKFYTDSGRQRIFSAESFTILRGQDGAAEITLHMKDHADDFRVDIEWDGWGKRDSSCPPVFQKAIIENASGRTTEIIALGPDPRKAGNSDTGRIIVSEDGKSATAWPPGMAPQPEPYRPS